MKLFRRRRWEYLEEAIRDAQKFRTQELRDAARAELIDALDLVSEQWRQANTVPYRWLNAPNAVLRAGLTPAERMLINIPDRPHDTRRGIDPLEFFSRQSSKATLPFQSSGVMRKRDDDLLRRLENHRNQFVWPTLTPIQRSAIQNYTLTPGLHSYSRFRPGYISPLILALRDLILPEPVIAYRVELATRGARRDGLLRCQPGDVLEWHHPLSTRVTPDPLGSLSKGGDSLNDPIFSTGDLSGGYTIIFEMYVTRGLYVGKQTLVASTDEQELLIPAGSKWLVRGHVDVYAEDHNFNPVRRHMVQIVQT